MEDPTDDPRQFAHISNVDFEEDGLPPGIDTFLRMCPSERCSYPLKFRRSHSAGFDGAWNGEQTTSDSPPQH